MDLSIKKPNLLFLTPVIPAQDKGIRKRCYMHLMALSAYFEIDMVVLSKLVSFSLDDVQIDEACVASCRSISIYPMNGSSRILWKLSNRIRARLPRLVVKSVLSPYTAMRPSKAEIREIAECLPGTNYDVVFGFRMSAGRVALGLRRLLPNLQRAKMYLDLDDIESVAKWRESQTLRKTQGRLNSWAKRMESKSLASIERTLCSKFDRVFVCSGIDVAKLSGMYPGISAMAIPNAVPEMLGVSEIREQGAEVPELLFVGSMDHGPNVDAIHYFIADVLPLIRESCPVRFRFRIVGRYPRPEILRYAELPDVEVDGDVESIEPCYERARVVVAPIRFGGGTRLKILEAFACERPVVSTSIGAEGIDAEDAIDIMLADTPRLFADACIELLLDLRKAKTIAASGRRLFENYYSYQALGHRIPELLSLSAS